MDEWVGSRDEDNHNYKPTYIMKMSPLLFINKAKPPTGETPYKLYCLKIAVFIMRSLIMVIIYQKKISKCCQRIHNNECFSLKLNEQVAYIERSLWNILIFLSRSKELIFMQIRSKLPQFRWLLSTTNYRSVQYHRSQLYLSAWLDCVVMNKHWDFMASFSI